uniref:Ras-related protein Rab-36 n=1 Tax=Eptatretus burgeri TaxID=7764 RepID=A0A8C4QG37_EPTBU
MNSPIRNFATPISRDRVIGNLPKCYTTEACLQSKPHMDGRVRNACQQDKMGYLSLKISKIVVVGDVAVGKTCLIHRFCKDAFDADYKATIGVDFEVERFEICGVPYSLQIWDTAGQERFKCIASAYYRAAQVLVVAFDLSDIESLDHSRQWLEDAMKENDPHRVLVFLVGCKKDRISASECKQMETDAITVAKAMKAEYWSVSSKAGENVKDLFFRIASLAFEASLLQELERPNAPMARIGEVVNVSANSQSIYENASKKSCC